MYLKRILRLLRLLSLLQAGSGRNVDGLAAACGATRRTIFRDLDVLRQSGVPLVFDDERQCYHIPSTYYLPPTNFTPEEALALIVLCHELGHSERLPFFGPAENAAIKLQSSLPGRLREQVRGVADAIRIRSGPSNPLADKKPVYDQLAEAIRLQRCVRIRYQSLAEGEEIQTRLSPYRLLFSRRSWYVIGRSSLHRETRTFNIGRIRSLEPLDEAYQTPRGFSLDRYLRNAWHIIPERGRDHRVRIRFQKMVAQNVAEVVWHKTQQVSFNDDGTLDFSATVSGLHEISWWILGYGDQAEVLQPPELRQMIAQRVARMAERYGKG